MVLKSQFALTTSLITMFACVALIPLCAVCNAQVKADIRRVGDRTMKGDNEDELFRLDDTPTKPKSQTSHKSENSYRIFAMDSEVVVVAKAAMVLSLSE